MANIAMHANARRQDFAGPGRPTSIANPGATVNLSDGPLATAPSVPTYTEIPTTVGFETTIAGKVTTIETPSLVPITDSAAYASIISSESASSASAAAAETAKASATSEAASSGSSNNLGTLIPAIVVPIVVVLLASFGGFWFWMRRRHRKQLQNTDFAMAGKGEKLNSRSNSSRSGAPTAAAAEKSNFGVNTTEFTPPPPTKDLGPRDSYEAIGMGRGAEQNDSRTRSPNMPFNGSRDQGYQNFSGPRPNTAKTRPPPSRGEHQRRDRSNSTPGNRGPPPSGYRGPRGPPPPRDIGPSPIMRNHGSPPMGSGPARGLSPRSQPRAAPAPPGQGKMRAPSPTMAGLNRSNAPAALANPPPGAFNGASPISQYSPIVKETPNIGAVATFGSSPPKNNSPPRDNTRPPPIDTEGTGLGFAALAVSKDNSRSPSPRSPEESFLTEENMRIARLANSSRLGFNQTSKPTSPSPGTTHAAPQQARQPPARDFSKPLGFKKSSGPASGPSSPLLPLNTARSAPGQSPTATSTTNPSPKLPPPATLSQLIPSDSPRDERKPQWNYFGHSSSNNPDSPSSSVYSGLPPPHTRPLPASRNGPLRDSGSRRHEDDDAKSEVSDLGEYEDIDAKSDVSSLNEFERFDFDSQRGSRAGESVRSGTR